MLLLAWIMSPFPRSISASFPLFICEIEHKKRKWVVAFSVLYCLMAQIISNTIDTVCLPIIPDIFILLSRRNSVTRSSVMLLPVAIRALLRSLLQFCPFSFQGAVVSPLHALLPFCSFSFLVTSFCFTLFFGSVSSPFPLSFSFSFSLLSFLFFGNSPPSHHTT